MDLKNVRYVNKWGDTVIIPPDIETEEELRQWALHSRFTRVEEEPEE